MPANIYVPDRGIEFESVYNDTLQMIEDLKGIDITGYDIDAIKASVEDVKKNCNAEIAKLYSEEYQKAVKALASSASAQESNRGYLSYTEGVGIRAQVESIYNKGISTLNSIQSDLTPYNVYYTAHYSVQNIKNSLEESEEINPEQVKAFASSIIIILKQINESDTRPYSTEESIVDKIYELAYTLMKKEMLLFNKSTILTWAKGYPISSSFFRKEIFKDIKSIDFASGQKRLDTILSRIRGQKLNASYLDEELIKYLANYSNEDIDKIKEKLQNLYQKIRDTETRIVEKRLLVDTIGAKLGEVTSAIKKSGLVEEVAMIASCAGLLASLVFGSFKLPIFNSKTIFYKTYKDIYPQSEDVGIQTPNAPEYLPLIPEDEKLVLLEYHEWSQWKNRDGFYDRDIYRYPLNTVMCDTIEDYFDIDYKTFCERNKLSDYSYGPKRYDGIILEIVQYTQDLEDFEVDENNNYVFPLALAGFIWCVCIAMANALKKREVELICTVNGKEKETRKAKWGWMYYNICYTQDYCKEFIINVQARKETAKRLKAAVLELKKQCDEDDELKKVFVEAYESCQDMLPDDETKQDYMDLVRRIKAKKQSVK